MGGQRHHGRTAKRGQKEEKTAREIRDARKRREKLAKKQGKKKGTGGLVAVVSAGVNPWVPKITNANLKRLQRGQSTIFRNLRYEVDLAHSALPMTIFIRVTGGADFVGLFNIDLTTNPGTIERMSKDGKSIPPKAAETEKTEKPVRLQRPKQTGSRLNIPKLTKKVLIKLGTWQDATVGNWTFKPDRLNYPTPSDSGIVYFRVFYDIKNTTGQYQDRGIFELNLRRKTLKKAKEN